MTSRERFLRSMRFEKVDRMPIVTMGPWDDTKRRWKAEGMKSIEDELAAFDGPMQSCWLYGQFQGPIPPFEQKVLRETGAYQERQNYIGQVLRVLREGTSMPHFVSYPLRNRGDWQEYRHLLDPDSPGRYPETWAELTARRRGEAAGDIRGVAVWGFYGFLREMFGPERLSYLFYDDPALLAEMTEYWADFTMKRLSRAVREMDFDYALIWEDNCYNHGMLHSPKTFQELMAPHYRALVAFFRGNGIDIISVDSDGDVTALIPLLLDVGVTGMHPFEVAAGMDVIEIGNQYPNLQIWGGLDKRALAHGPEAIDQELERVIPAMKQRGGYAAGIDHLIPSDVSLENFRHYVRRLRELS